jgi:hypothetical protein
MLKFVADANSAHFYADLEVFNCLGLWQQCSLDFSQSLPITSFSVYQTAGVSVGEGGSGDRARIYSCVKGGGMEIGRSKRERVHEMRLDLSACVVRKEDK